MMTAVSDVARELYIELVKKSLTCSLYEANDGAVFEPFEGLRKPGDSLMKQFDGPVAEAS